MDIEILLDDDYQDILMSVSEHTVRCIFASLKRRYNSPEDYSCNADLHVAMSRMQQYLVDERSCIQPRAMISDSAREFLNDCPCIQCFWNEPCDQCQYNMPVNIWNDRAKFTFYQCRGRRGKHLCMECVVSTVGVRRRR